jgi:hypothetical protein
VRLNFCGGASGPFFFLASELMRLPRMRIELHGIFALLLLLAGANMSLQA